MLICLLWFVEEEICGGCLIFFQQVNENPVYFTFAILFHRKTRCNSHNILRFTCWSCDLNYENLELISLMCRQGCDFTKHSPHLFLNVYSNYSMKILSSLSRVQMLTFQGIDKDVTDEIMTIVKMFVASSKGTLFVEYFECNLVQIWFCFGK